MKYKLKEIFDLQMGKTPARNNDKYWNTKDYKWISIADLTSTDKYINNTKEYISRSAVKESGIKIIPANTVVMSFKLSIGKTAILCEDMYSNEAIMAFHDKHIVELLPEYIYYLIKAKNWTDGSNRAVMGKTLNKATLSEIEVDIHAIEEQRKIVKLMSSIEKVIYNRKEQLQKLGDILRARFVEMFGDPIRNTQNRSTVDVVDVVKMQRGFDLPVQERNQMGKIPVYGSNGVLGYHDIPKVKGGGIITGRSGTIGKVLYTESDYWPLNTTLFSADTYGNDVIYLSYLMEMYDLSRFIEGTGVPTLNRNKFHNKKIINVSINEQTQFSAFVKEVNKSKIEVQKALDKAQLLFDSLMQKYFE